MQFRIRLVLLNKTILLFFKQNIDSTVAWLIFRKQYMDPQYFEGSYTPISTIGFKVFGISANQLYVQNCWALKLMLVCASHNIAWVVITLANRQQGHVAIQGGRRDDGHKKLTTWCSPCGQLIYIFIEWSTFNGFLLLLVHSFSERETKCSPLSHMI